MKKLLLPLILLAACGSPGQVVVTTYGEDFIEKGIPAAEIEDGWDVTFSKFLVTLGEIRIAASDGEVGAALAAARVWDATKPGPVTIATFEEVGDRHWDLFSYAIAPSASATAGNADAADVERMTRDGLAVWVEGSATKDAVTKTFRWGFAAGTVYERCSPHEGEPGVTVPSGGEAKVDLTLHGDHLFFDDLQDPDAKMRFEAMADADTDEDGEVTLEELAGVDLTALPLGTYGTGSVPEVENLRQFVEAQIPHPGHFQGEGECQPKAR